MRQKAVLVVDRRADSSAMFSARLRASGYQVMESSTAPHAFRTARELAPDLIVTRFPVDAGEGGLMDLLRREEATRSIPVVSTTGRPLRQDDATGGVVEFGLFRAGPGQLLQTIHDVLKRAEQVAVSPGEAAFAT